jgi:hypothetical protein
MTDGYAEAPQKNENPKITFSSSPDWYDAWPNLPEDLKGKHVSQEEIKLLALEKDVADAEFLALSANRRLCVAKKNLQKAYEEYKIFIYIK